MASQIKTIFDRVAALVVTVNGLNITGYALAETTTTVTQPPKRIVSPLSDKNEGREALRISFGTPYSVTWMLTDLLLWAATEDGSGLEYEMQWLVEYMGKYLDVINANKKLGFTNHVKIETAQCQIGTFEYPLASGQWYHGCKADVEILEIVT